MYIKYLNSKMVIPKFSPSYQLSNLNVEQLSTNQQTGYYTYLEYATIKHFTGPNDFSFFTGPTGAPGQEGSQGPTGSQGLQGPTGPSGQLNIIGSEYGDYIYWNTGSNNWVVGSSNVTIGASAGINAGPNIVAIGKYAEQPTGRCYSNW